MAKDNSNIINDYNNNKRLIISILLITIIVSMALLIAIKLFDRSDPLEVIDKNTNTTLELRGTGFPTIQLGHYALWAKVNGEPVFLRRFNSTNNQITDLYKQPFLEQSMPYLLKEVEEIFVTIELEGDRDEIPNGMVLMSTKDLSSPIKLDFSYEDLTTTEGTFILATPTDGNDNLNETSGLWFYDNESEQNSLNLINLDNNWIYQARIIDFQDLEFNIGRFSLNSISDSSDRYSDKTSQGFMTPGEDFLTNLPNSKSLINLANGNYKLIVSLEPNFNENDLTGEEVFLPILETNIAKDSKPNEQLNLSNVFQPPELILTTKEDV